MKDAVLAPEHAVPTMDPPVPWPGRRVQLDGRATFVRDIPGTGPGAQPAVYVHGLGGSAHNWTDLAGLLAHRLDGQALDLPGFGHSDPAERYALTAFAARVVRWIEATDRGPVHLFGNSLGGSVSALVAARRPDLVRTLTLISPAMPFLDVRRTAHLRLLPVLALPGASRIAGRRLAAVPPERFAAEILAACVARPERLSRQRLAEAVEEVRLRYQTPWHLDAYVGTMRSLVAAFVRAYLPGPGSLWRLLTRIEAPTLVIGGALDRLVDPRVPAVVARLIPDSRLLILPDVGHVAQIEVPVLTARAVLGLLDEVAGAGHPVVPARAGYRAG